MDLDILKKFIEKSSLFNVSCMEKSVGCPHKTISKWAQNKVKLPSKWEKPISDYIDGVFATLGFAKIDISSEISTSAGKNAFVNKHLGVKIINTSPIAFVPKPKPPITEETSEEIPAWLKKLNEQVKERENAQNKSDSEEAEDDFIDNSLTPEQWIQWRNECFSADEHIGWRKALYRTQHLTDKIKKEILATGIV